MSAYTKPKSRIQIQEEKINSLTKEQNQLRTLNKSLNDKLKAHLDSGNNLIKDLQKQADKRSEQYNTSLKVLKTELKNIDSKFSKELENQSLQFYKEHNKLRDDTSKALLQEKAERVRSLNEQKLQLESLIEKEKQRTNSELIKIKEDISIISKQIENQNEFAKDILSDIKLIIEKTFDEFPNHNKFAPGEIESIQEKIAIIAHDVGFAPQSVIAGVRDAYFQLASTKKRIKRNEDEYNAWRIDTLNVLAALQETINSNRVLQLDGVEQEANYWTYGKFDQLSNKVGDWVTKLEANNQNLTIEEIKRASNSYDDLKHEYDEIISHALKEIMASQLRFEVGDSIIKSLESQGFTVKKEGYEKNDFRNAYLVKLADPTKTEIVAIINPEENFSNSITINSSDATFQNPTLALERLREISNNLQKDTQLKIDLPECIDESEGKIEDIYGTEFEEIYVNGIPTKLRNKLGLSIPKTL